MKKIIYLLLIFCIPTLVFSQRKSCNKKKQENLEDLNAISVAKCKITSSKKNKKSGQINVTVSANKARFRKKRTKGTKEFRRKNTSMSMSSALSTAEVKKARKFIEVDKVPAFKACKSARGDDRIDCFNKEMVSHIQYHFSYPDEAIMKKIEGKVWIRFIIDKRGNVRNIKAHVLGKGKTMLKKEALRVVSNLKQFSPAIRRGKPVATKYGFPINFSLPD